MRTASAAIAIFLALANLALGQGAPQGAPPTLKSVASADSKKGQIIYLDTVSRLVPVQKEVVVVENGQKVAKVVTVYETVLEQRHIVLDVANSRVITPDGKQLPIDEVWKRATKGAVIALSANSNPPAAAYLRALSPETLVIIPPAVSPMERPQPIEAPPVKKK